MTSKLSWITFVPFTLVAIAIKLYQAIFMVDSDATLFGLSSLILDYIAIACVVLVLLFSVLFVLIDKKTAQYYKTKRNIVAGVFGVLIAVLFACDGANSIFALIEVGNFGILGIVDSILTLLVAVVFIVIGLSHFVGNGTTKGLAVFYLFPAFWAAIRLVRLFLDFTKVSIITSDVSLLVSYIFLTMFFFNYAMLISLIKGKSPVKTTLVFAFPAATACLLYAAGKYQVVFSEDFFSNAYIFELALIGVYIIAFLIELTINMKTKDEVSVIETEEEVEEKEEISEDELRIQRRNEVDAEGIITGLDQETKDAAPVHSYLETQDTSDFIVDVVAPVEQLEEKEYIAGEDSDKYFITQGDGQKEEEPEDSPMKDVDTRMDEIDKLILQISEENGTK